MSPWERRLGVWWIGEDHPELPAIVASHAGVTATFGELTSRAHQLVHALGARGIDAGDVVAYALPNGADIGWWQLAFQESGIQSIALNPALSQAEMRSIVDHSGAVGVVVHLDYADRVDDLAGAASITTRVSVGGTIPGFFPETELIAGHPTTEPERRTMGMPISYSSGTTGTPKAIVRRAVSGDPSVIADAMKIFGQAFQFQPLEGVHLVSTGMHHGGCQSFYQGALNVGQALAIMGRFDAEATLRMIEEHRVTTAYMVPTQFVRLLRLPEDVRARYDLSSL